MRPLVTCCLDGHNVHAATFYFICLAKFDAAGFIFCCGSLKRVRRCLENDAGGLENQLFNFIWPNPNLLVFSIDNLHDRHTVTVIMC